MVHTLNFFYQDGSHAFTTEDFSSLRLSSLFQDHPFPALTCFRELDKTDSSDDLFKAATDIANTINNSNDIIVTGWNKKGVVNNQSNNETNRSIAAGATTIHPVHTVGTNLDEDDIEYMIQNKFKIASMNISE